jgi:hypothetical protein
MDKYDGFANLVSQAERWKALPALGQALTETPKGLFFNAAGTVVLMGKDGVTASFTVAASQTLDVRPLMVVAAGTSLTAPQIILLLD